MEKKKTARKLTLHRETLRTLEGEELREAGCGITGNCQTNSFCHVCPTTPRSVCLGCQ
jgi:hypothetical protein